MNISIKALGEPDEWFGLQSFIGQIRIEKFEELFIMPIEYWSREDYEQQWKEGLKRIKTHNQSCLIASIQDPFLYSFVIWWILYKDTESKTIFVQNCILPPEVYARRVGSRPFTRETCYNFIPSRKTVTEEGDKISEWKVELED